MRALALVSVLAVAMAAPALANDSTAELGAGGLELIRNDQIDLLSEDLLISTDAVKVTYHFRNHTDAPVTYVVAFPLPPIDATVPEDINIVLPDPTSPNFVDFKVTVDGKPVEVSLDERATALGVDRTDELKRRGLPLNPIADGLYDTLDKLPASDRAELNQLGLLLVDPYNVFAAWKLETTFYWEQTFPPGKEIVIEHEYKPVVGFGFFGEHILDDATYRETFCIDDDFVAAARRKLAPLAGRDNPYMNEQRISYILTTAQNWSGPIGRFRLVVDKGSPEALVSFCGTGVKKIAPTQFEMTINDFIPEQELNILVATPFSDR